MSTPFVGEIRLFSFPRIPTGWFACDGSLVSIAQYQVLFTLLGTTYGGDGINTFGLPDLRGQLPLHQGTGLGLTPRVIGEVGGTEGVTLTLAQLPLHTHNLMATSSSAAANAPGAAVLPGALGSNDSMYATNMTGTTQATLAASAVGFQGGSTAHDNTMPTLTVSYCIAWEGIFPSQS